MAYGAILGQSLNSSPVLDNYFTKNQTLTSATSTLIGLSANAIPNDMFNVLSTVGDLYVWKRTTSSGTDFPVSTNRNAYQEESDAQPAGYTLGDTVVARTNLVYGPNENYDCNYYYASSIIVSNDGSIELDQFKTYVSIAPTSAGASNANALKGKFVVRKNAGASVNGVGLPISEVYYFPEETTFKFSETGINDYGYVYADRYQKVTGYAAIPASNIVDYIGQLGDKARIVTGSYVGTGTYGKYAPTIITFPSPPKIVFIIQTDQTYGYRTNIFMYGAPLGTCSTTHASETGGSGSSSVVIGGVKINWEENQMSFYNTRDANSQLNGSNVTYMYSAIL